MPPPPTAEPVAPVEQFIAHLAASLAEGSFVKLLLGRPRAGAAPDLRAVSARRLALRGEDGLSFVYRHATRDVTVNQALAAGLATVRDTLLPAFAHAHLLTTRQDIQLAQSKRGRPLLRVGRVHAAASDAAAPAHDREKNRFLDLARPFLVELGVTDAAHRLIPAMSRKWKQINKFVEILDHALHASGLVPARDGATNPPPARPKAGCAALGGSEAAQPQAGGHALRVLDFGSGKGYLTFAVHDYLGQLPGLSALVTGVELREDLVVLCNAAARRLNLAGLDFVQGDVRSFEPGAVDVMIALHACDTATDVAIHRGIAAGAAVILCSPCCHKQLRPQMASPALLQPLLQHGIHMGQEAEMVTDGLRALLLESENYATQVFEFVSLEHTSKNKMILAVKRKEPLLPARRAELLRQIDEIKRFYGVREQCLETLLCASA